MSNNRILLVLGNGSRDRAPICPSEHKPTEELAFRHARSTQKKLVVLQVLYSKLYHWGHTDPIVPGRGRNTFIQHIRHMTLTKGMITKSELEKKAETSGISMEFKSIESENPDGVVLAEARRGYDAIFIPREKKRTFPLFAKTLSQKLRKKSFENIIVC